MARTITHAKLESATARARLKRGRQPHWQALIAGQAHIGWQRWPHDPCGRWMLRRHVDGKYSVSEIGKADDHHAADGQHILNFTQASAKARSILGQPHGKTKVIRMTVRQAFALYLEHKAALDQDVTNVRNRGTAHILPSLGDLVIDDLEPARLRRWLADMAAQPGQKRPTADGKLQWLPGPKTEDEKRKRRSSANRVLTILKAVLNHAFDEGHVSNNDAWGRKLKRLRNATAARVRYLELDECKRLLNACPEDFRALVRGGLETGCRYSELTRMQVGDFNKAAGVVAVSKSKTGKARHVVLTEDGISFFAQHCLGRDRTETMFLKANGKPWFRSEQKKRMDAACLAARIKPRATFHCLRHTQASLSAMSGVPLMVIAKNLGHVDTKMVEHHYGHLAPSFIVDAIRAGAPRFGAVENKRVVPLKG
jgi:integrase